MRQGTRLIDSEHEIVCVDGASEGRVEECPAGPDDCALLHDGSVEDVLRCRRMSAESGVARYGGAGQPGSRAGRDDHN